MHLGIVMDGNRRWAEDRGLPVFEGHRQGAEKIEEVCQWCLAREIKVLTLFVFSTENWRRPPKEVNFLMKLVKLFFPRKIKKVKKAGVRIKVIGQREMLYPELQRIIQEAERSTENNDALILNLALSYGGRAEIVETAKKIIGAGIPAEKINEELINSHLYTAGLPDPDLIIRTGGEQRFSNFLIWQGAYSELYFCKKHWPDFSEKDLDEALTDYASRERRHGK